MASHRLTLNQARQAGSGLVKHIIRGTTDVAKDRKEQKGLGIITQPTRDNMHPNITNFNIGSVRSNRMDALMKLGLNRRKGRNVKQRATK